MRPRRLRAIPRNRAAGQAPHSAPDRQLRPERVWFVPDVSARHTIGRAHLRSSRRRPREWRPGTAADLTRAMLPM